MSGALERFADLLTRAGKRSAWNPGRAAFKFQCPIHDDRTPSCDATSGDRVPVIASCQVCGDSASLPLMLEELGASDEDRDVILGGKPSGNGSGPADETVHHVYRDAKGMPVLRIVRVLHHGKTAKVQRQYYHAGEWRWPTDLPKSAKPNTRGLLYNAANVIAAAGQGQLVHVAEGERCVDALVGLGLPATCNAGGASEDGKSPKWTETHAAQLRGTRAVVVWEDNDAPGRAHANAVAASLVALGIPARVVRFPDAPPKFDVLDWLNERAGLPLEERRAALLELVKTAAPRTGTEPPTVVPAESPTADRSRLVQSSLTGSGILAHPFERRTALLGSGIIAAGDLVVYVGKTKLGKTWTALQLALAMARGEPWFGIPTAHEPVNVGFLELELLGDAMQDRLQVLTGGDVPDRFHLVVRPALRGPFDLVDKQGVPVHLDELRAWVEAAGLKVVFVDALARATSCDQNDLSPLLLALDHLRADLGVCIILIHHEGKPDRNAHGEGDDLDAGRGDSRLSGFAQAIVRVVKKSGSLRAIRFAGVSNGPTPDPIYFTLDPATGVPRPTQAPESVARGNRERVLNVVLGAAGPLSCGEVAKLANLSDAAARKHLGTLCDEGQIGRTGENRGTRYHSATRLPATPAMLDGVAGVSASVAERWGDD